MIIVNKIIVPKGYAGITLFPFIFLSKEQHKLNGQLINHEKIHLRQQIEMLIIPFYLWYGIEYAVRLIQYKDRYIAYKNISFEREAYSNQSNIDYLKNRRWYSFLKYTFRTRYG